MKKKLLVLIILLVNISVPLISLAGDFGLGSDLDAYAGGGNTSSKFVDKIEVLLAVIKNVGIVLSVVILIIIGMKYILGSVEEKADYKKSMMPYIYGTCFLFAGSFIPQLIYDIVKNIGWI